MAHATAKVKRLDRIKSHCEGATSMKMLPMMVGTAFLMTPAGAEVVANKRTQGDFERIFEYTLFNKTLPDGKHPVWVYYQSGEKIIRIDMPSMDMCVVTPQSRTDIEVINSKNYDLINRSSPN